MTSHQAMEVGETILQCQTNSQPSDTIHQRRSGNYKPDIWKNDFLESLDSKYDGEEYRRKAEKLIENVKNSFVETKELLSVLELVDSVKKLGLGHQFENEITRALDTIASTENTNPLVGTDLYPTALYFRLLRQHGYEVSQDIFSGFMDGNGSLKRGTLNNIRGMVELFEASNVALEGENTLQMAKASTVETLKGIISDLDCEAAKHVTHSLELSLQWRVHWYDVRWQINAFEKNEKNTDTVLLELAKLNFNMVQATHQKDLKELSRWWKSQGLSKDLYFARDRLADNFMCALGVASETKYKSLRKWLTKASNFIFILDDIYDIYGSYEELKQFTHAVDRWDVRETDQLPECLKKSFQSLYNTTTEIANEIQVENGSTQVLPHLQKVWADLCKAYFVEAEWYHKGYTPSFQEYLKNGWISSSGPVLLLILFLSQKDEDNEDMVNFLEKNYDLVYHISLIFRLSNDIATSKIEQERGDAPSSIVCYMQEMNVSENIAQMHIKSMINKSLQKINKKCFSQVPCLSSLVNITVNVARVVQSIYQYGDAISYQDKNTKNKFLYLLVEPLDSK